MKTFRHALALFAFSSLCLLPLSAFGTTTSTTAKLGVDQGGARSYVANGGHMDVESGGYVDFQSGGALQIAETAVTSTAAEINTMHGITSTTSELNIMHGVTATAAQLNAAIQGSLCVTGACTETSTTNAGALSVLIVQSLISSAGSESRTLAAPGGNGITKIIAMTVHGGDVTLAGTNIWGNTSKTCTFAAIGDSMILMSVGGKWLILGQNGATCA